MLCISRSKGDEIAIGGSVRVKVVDLGRGRVVIGIDAPRGTQVLRAELLVAQAKEPPKGDGS